MKSIFRPLVAFAIISLMLTTKAQGQTNPSKESIDTNEEAEYKNVNSFDLQSLQRFLKAFPLGKNSQNAKDALELVNLIQKIREGRIKAKYVIPFKNLGGGKYWAGSGIKGFTGHNVTSNSIGVFFGPFNGGGTPGYGMISFDGNGNPREALTDGSIIGFITNGVNAEYYGGTKLKTPANAPAYFAVIKGKGLVHLKGAVTVTIKGKAPVEIK